MTTITKLPTLIELPPLNHQDAWEDPIYFDDGQTPEIPSKLLPNVCGDFAHALATATETAESLSVMTILGVLAAATSKYFMVTPKPGWQEPLNLYTLIALPPANNKSYVLKSCTKPLIDWELEQSVLLEQEIKRAHSVRKSQEKIIEGLRVKVAKEKDVELQKKLIEEIAQQETSLVNPPLLPQLFANDATPESLAMNAYEQDGTFALFSDEGGILDTLGGLYSNGLANIDIFLKGIDGGNIRVRRKDRSFNLNPYLTVVLAVQPAIIEKLGNKKSFYGNGAFERFLYVLPKSKLGFRTHDTSPIPSNVYEDYCQKIRSILNLRAKLKSQQQTHLLQLSHGAFEIWSHFQKIIEHDLRPNGRLSSCLGWGGKICGFALRIAGLLHVAENESLSSHIQEENMHNAIDIAYILTDHALKAYDLLGVDETHEDAKVVFNWILTNGNNQFRKTDLILAMRKYRKLGKSEQLQKALKVLIDRNLISTPQKLPTRKPTTVYYVNPAILQKYSSSVANSSQCRISEKS